MFDLTTGAVIFCVLTGMLFLGLWLGYERRDRRAFDAERRRTTFHCVRCHHLYAAKRGAETAACPQCAHENARLKF